MVDVLCLPLNDPFLPCFSSSYVAILVTVMILMLVRMTTATVTVTVTVLPVNVCYVRLVGIGKCRRK